MAAEAHLLEEPAPLVGAVSETSVVVSPGTLLRVKARRLLLRLGLAHRTRSWVGTAASSHRGHAATSAQDAELRGGSQPTLGKNPVSK